VRNWDGGNTIIEIIRDYLLGLNASEWLAFLAFVVSLLSFRVSRVAAKNSLLASDGPRIVFTGQRTRGKREKESDDFTKSYSVRFSNVGKGLAFRVFLLYETKVGLWRKSYYLSMPVNNVKSDSDEIEIAVKMIPGKKFKAYLLTMDFFGNLHVTNGYELSNKHLKYLKTYNKSYSPMSLGSYKYKYYMRMARKQKNTDIDKLEESFKSHNKVSI
jgi:hypothetical protein